jgi:hypothetical protein
VWDLHDNPEVPTAFDPSISRGLGLPSWTNHLAFAASGLDELTAVRERWRGHGYDVLQIDHGWCTSIYLDDPNGIAVECCCTTRAFTPDDAAEADTLRRAARPPLGELRAPEVYEATGATVRGSRAVTGVPAARRSSSRSDGGAVEVARHPSAPAAQ